MPQIKPAARPGVFSQFTQVQAQGQWFAGNLVRWRLGLLEKMGGWRRLTSSMRFPSVIRKLHAWLDLDSRKNLLVAGDFGVGILVQDTQYTLGSQISLQGGYILEIGPTGDTTTFSAVLGSKTVTVKTSAVAAVGETFVVELSISIGGRVILAGTLFNVKSVIDGVGFTFDMPLPALADETDAYGLPLLTNNIVNVMTVTWKAHGFVVGSSIKFAQATTVRLGVLGTWEKVNFSAPAGTTITVDTVVDADTFTFQMGALGTGDGAGGTNHQVFVGSSTEHDTSTGGMLVTSVGTVIGLARPEPLGNPQSHTWFLNNLGQDGLALATGGPLEVYKPPIENGPFLAAVGSTAPISAPQKSNGMLVAMPQAQVILWGSEPILGSGVIDPLLIRFSDVGTYDVYTATASNQAGSFRLSRGSKIMGAIQAPQTTYILTDTDIWSMSYIGPPLVYGFTMIGTGCGLVAPHAIGTLGRVTIWQSQKNFWQVGDTGVQPYLCTVWDYVFEDVDSVNVNKCFAAPNSSTNEMGFYFPSLRTRIIESGNLLLFSQLFSDPHWIKTGVTAVKIILFKLLYVYEPQYAIAGYVADEGIPPVSWFNRDLQGIRDTTKFPAPDGTDTAFNLIETATNSTHSISQKIEKVGEQLTYTFSLYVHNSSTRNITLRAVTKIGNAFATFTPDGEVIKEGVTSSRFALNDARVVIDDLATDRLENGNGWWRFVMTFTSDDGPELELFINLTKGTELSYLGTPPDGAMIWGAQLVFGTDPLPYQKTEGELKQNEDNHYVKVNLVENGAWDSGVLKRSAWIDNSIWGTPLGADANRRVQQHERGYDDDDQPMRGVFAETGFTEVSDGSIMMMVDEVQPDLKWFGVGGGVKIKLRAKNYAQGPEHLYGPYSMTSGTQFFSPRTRSHYVAVRYEWEPLKGFSARLGSVSFRVKPAGRRP